MKGIMTVRKWIDRSIAGMEMRSGDYPVTNSEYVAIIVVLSGLENIPRITEIREIREQYQSGVSRGVPGLSTSHRLRVCEKPVQYRRPAPDGVAQNSGMT